MIEGDKVRLNCCTNSDISPQAKFKWFKSGRSTSAATELINTNNVKLLNGYWLSEDAKDLCNSVELSVNRYDNNYEYKCSVSNEALVTGLTDTIRLAVECKKKIFLI